MQQLNIGNLMLMVKHASWSWGSKVPEGGNQHNLCQKRQNTAAGNALLGLQRFRLIWRIIVQVLDWREGAEAHMAL